MDPVIHVSEGHRSDMLLDLSGLSHEERFIVQAAINNERDFDRVADALSIPHPRIHLRESRKRTRAKGKTSSNVETIQTHGGFAEKARVHTLAAENLDQVLVTRMSIPLKTVIMMTTLINPADAYHAYNDPVDPGSDDEERTLDDNDDEEHDTFSSYVALDDVIVFEAADLDAIALLAGTWDNELDPEVGAPLVQASAQAYLSFGKEKRKGKGKGKSKGIYPCSPVTFVT